MYIFCSLQKNTKQNLSENSCYLCVYPYWSFAMSFSPPTCLLSFCLPLPLPSLFLFFPPPRFLSPSTSSTQIYFSNEIISCGWMIKCLFLAYLHQKRLGTFCDCLSSKLSLELHTLILTSTCPGAQNKLLEAVERILTRVFSSSLKETGDNSE